MLERAAAAMKRWAWEEQMGLLGHHEAAIAGTAPVAENTAVGGTAAVDTGAVLPTALPKTCFPTPLSTVCHSRTTGQRRRLGDPPFVMRQLLRCVKMFLALIPISPSCKRTSVVSSLQNAACWPP